jgi:hypothetical protein
MANILTVPSDGSIYFSDDAAGSSVVPNLTGNAVSLNYDASAGLNITSYNTTNLDRFNVNGSGGRLFSITDSLTGIIFSVNDAAGLPILEVESDVVDTVRIGTFGLDALTISTSSVNIGSNTSNINLEVSGSVIANNLVYLEGVQTIDGEKTFTDDTTLISENNTLPNQVLTSDDSILTRGTKVFDDVFRHSMRWRSFPVAGQTRDGGNFATHAGGIRARVGTSAQSAAIINMAENWISNDEESTALIPFNNPFILHCVYTFYIGATTTAIQRVYVGHNGLLTSLPWSGEDPVPAYRRSIGFEVRGQPSPNRTEIRLFARDGIFGVSEGSMIFSDWFNLATAGNNLNSLTCAILEHDPISQSVKLYARLLQGASERSRIDTTPILTLSGVGVPNTQEDSGSNWDKIIGVIVSDNINTQSATAHTILVREVNVEFL